MTTNRDFARFPTKVFERACKIAGIMPTKRQASKWRASKGLARKFMHMAINQLAAESHDAEKATVANG